MLNHPTVNAILADSHRDELLGNARRHRLARDARTSARKGRAHGPAVRVPLTARLRERGVVLMAGSAALLVAWLI
jgi:hypothetical protein